MLGLSAVVLFVIGLTTSAIFFVVTYRYNKKLENPDGYSRKRLPLVFWVGLGIGALSILLFLALSVLILDETEVSSRKCFGKLDMEFQVGGGMHFVSPFCSYTSNYIGEINYKFETLENLSNAPMTADSVKMNTILNFPVAVNPAQLNLLISKFKTKANFDKVVVANSYWDAVRRAFSQFYWEVPKSEDQVSGEKYLYIDQSRDELSKALVENFNFIVKSKLLKAGFNEDQAESAFIVGYPTISGLLPPDSISKAINEQKKADAELKRQATITEIEREKANRGIQVGARFNNLVSAVYGKNHNATPENIIGLMDATANITRADADLIRAKAEETKADAIEKAVNLGGVNTIVMGGSPNIAVPAN